MNRKKIDYSVLEPSQRSFVRAERLTRRTLDRRTFIALCVLRLYVTFAVPVVVVAFVRALSARH